MSKASSFRPSSPSPGRKVAAVVAMLAAILLLFYGVPQLTSRIPKDGTPSHPPVAASTAQASAGFSKTCQQMVPPSAQIDVVSEGTQPEARPWFAPVPLHGYCAAALARSPLPEAVVPSLPRNEVMALCVVFNVTPDKTTVRNRNVAVFALATSLTVGTVSGVYADGTPFTATPIAVIAFVGVDKDLNPQALPGELMDILAHVQDHPVVAAIAATTSGFGIPVTPDIHVALQAPGWK